MGKAGDGLEEGAVSAKAHDVQGEKWSEMSWNKEQQRGKAQRHGSDKALLCRASQNCRAAGAVKTVPGRYGITME